jgi:hypothetical protein
MKKCSKCKGEKDLGEFSKNKSNKDGISTVCKPCAKIVAKEWRQKNRYDGRIVASKTCSTCQTTKPVEKFWKDASKADGFTGE